ncbi:unnamed protein product [Ophioblennius macclurei]
MVQKNQGESSGCDNGGFHPEEVGPSPSVPQEGRRPAKPKKRPVPPGVVNTNRSTPAAAAARTAKKRDSSDKRSTPATAKGAERKSDDTDHRKCAGWKVVLAGVLLIPVYAGLLWYFSTYTACMTCKSGPDCISPSRWCDGIRDCYDGEDESYCFRLSGTKSMLEGFSTEKRRWLPVCAEAWNDSYGMDVCEHMGFRSQDYVSSGQTHVGYSHYNGYMTLKHGSTPDLNLKRLLVYSESCSKKVVTVKCIECGRSSVDPSARIVGGTEAENGAWPWQVSLQIKGRHVCGGSIISPTWILSAAHCFHEHNNSAKWRVHSGDVSLSRMDRGRMIQKIFSHKDYDPLTNENDIALLKLGGPIVFGDTLKAVCIPNFGQFFGPDSEAWITGWGRLRQFDTTAPDLLNQAQVKIYTRETCNSRHVLDGVVTEKMICAGKLEGGVDTCQGDSGGPLVVRYNRVWWLAGGTSFGFGCALRNKPGVYTNVTSFTDWIQKTMKKL